MRILSAILVLLLAGCQINTKQESLDDHHDEAKILITAYSNEFELFAEADPFVAGKESSILSHFTHLPDFKALENGSITIRLEVNGTESSHRLDAPTRKGIYRFDLTPEATGKGQLHFDIKTEKGEFQLTVPDVQVFSNDHDAIHAAEEVVFPSTNATSFTKEQSWKIDFATELPITGPFGQVIKTTAKVQPAQGDEMIITAKTSGIALLSEENVLPGKSVTTRDVLCTISGSGLANNNASVQFLEAQNNYVRAKADYDRLKELAKDKIVSERELLDAKNQYENAKAVFDNLNKNFTESGQTIRSPMNGFIRQVFIGNGQYVEAGQPIVIVSQNKTLLLQAEVQQKYAPLLATITSANIRSPFNNQTYTLEQLNGKVVSFGRNTNTDNFLIPVSLQIDNTAPFMSGGFIEVYLKTVSSPNALTVPNTALLEEQGKYFVFVQVHPELFEKREVQAGVTDGLRTEVLKGITHQERIVTVGAVMVKLAQSTGTLDAHSGHVH